MTAETKPFLAVYVAWHPDFVEGRSTAKFLFDHFRRNIYKNVAGGSGIPVQYRWAIPPANKVPIDINLDTAETTAIVLLVEETWVADLDWCDWARELIRQAELRAPRAMVFPVAMDRAGLNLGISHQAIRWDQWSGDTKDRRRLRLTTDLTYAFCRLLRQYIDDRTDSSDDDRLIAYLKPLEVFVSHSKHDDYGTVIAEKIRQFVNDRGYDSFFDVIDIPVGTLFDKVLMMKIRTGMVVAIHTDSYSSREWCRKEMIQAKRHQVPLVVANCIRDADERGFPYMANVPIIRMDPIDADRIDAVVGRLLDEALKDFLWQCRVKTFRSLGTPDVAFLSRPPELISLIALRKIASEPLPLVVYPDPPVGLEELELFDLASPGTKLLSATEWLTGNAT